MIKYIAYLKNLQMVKSQNWINYPILSTKLTESAVMTSEGGTKSNFSPFLIFFKATKPLSPTSTFCMAIFWGGRPESDSHLWRASAFCKESISQPHGTFGVTDAAFSVALSLVETDDEQWIVVEYFLRKKLGDWVSVHDLWSIEKEGKSVVWKILEASTMAVHLKEWEEEGERPYPYGLLAYLDLGSFYCY